MLHFYLQIYLRLHRKGGDELFDLSLEELMNIEIVSASKKAESLFDAPVSSYIISKEAP